MKSVIDEALETGHDRFKRGEPRDNRGEEGEEENRNIRSLPVVQSKPPVEYEEKVDELDTKQDIKDDYTNARNIGMQLLEQQQILIQGMTDYLNACPSPRAYEVINNMMKTASEMTERLLGVQTQLKEAQAEARKSGGTGEGGDTFIFAGGPSEILKQVKKAAEAEEKIIDITPDE